MQKTNNKADHEACAEIYPEIYTGTGTLPAVSRPDRVTDLIYPYPHR